MEGHGGRECHGGREWKEGGSVMEVPPDSFHACMQAHEHMSTMCPRPCRAQTQGRQTLRNMPAQPQLPAKHDDQRVARESCRIGVAAVKCKHFQGGGVAKTLIAFDDIEHRSDPDKATRGAKMCRKGSVSRWW